jgi:signal transduction histidine kinase
VRSAALRWRSPASLRWWRGVRVDQLPAALAALAMALAGAAVLVGPYIGRLTTQLRDEERARIRDQERNDMAAHLHDSVLQTLALIRRARQTRDEW